MKKSLFPCFIIALIAMNAAAQNAKLNITIINPKLPDHVQIFDPMANYADLKNQSTPITFNARGSGSATIDVPQAKYVTLSIYNNSGMFSGLGYPLFLSPGDDMDIRVNFAGDKSKVTITGRGANNNQPEFKRFTDVFADDNNYRKDRSPYRLLNDIKRDAALNQKMFNEYLKRIKATDNGMSKDQPTAEFIKVTRYNLDYYTTIKFYSTETDLFFMRDKPKQWQHIQDSLFRVIKLNNDDALPAFNYQMLATHFMIRERERISIILRKQPAEFYKEWYNTTNITEGEKLMAQTSPTEKVINKYFSGKTAEFLYVDQLKAYLMQSNYKNIDVLFAHFKQRYPSSKYIAWFRGPIAAIVAQQNNRKLNDKMIITDHNGSNYNTLKEVIAANKGKTILVDMWGTWCSPCREEIEKNSAALHNSLKGKPVTFLYIANYDLQHEANWKKMIAYYQIEGVHILASDKLTKNIEANIHSSSYPTYFIIKKDGTYKMSKCGYPMDSRILIKEVNAAL